jgi:hypothetical protein
MAQNQFLNVITEQMTDLVEFWVVLNHTSNDMANNYLSQALFVMPPTVHTTVVSEPKTGDSGVTL